MSAQLADPRQAARTTGSFPPAAVAPHAPVVESLEDVDRGIGMLLRFTGGILVMVVDVVAIGAVDRSWILIPGFAVLLATAALIFIGIMRLLQDGADEDPS